MIWNERIKSMRIFKGYTLKDVAKVLGVTEATAQRYESSAIKSVPYDCIIKYADMFDCSPSYLLGWEDSELTDSEMRLLAYYRKLSDNGKHQLEKQAEYLFNDDEYKGQK